MAIQLGNQALSWAVRRLRMRLIALRIWVSFEVSCCLRVEERALGITTHSTFPDYTENTTDIKYERTLLSV